MVALDHQGQRHADDEQPDGRDGYELRFAAPATPRLLWYYFAAVLLHAAANIPAALSQLGLLRSMWCIEGIILAVNAAVCLFVWSVYRKACVHRPLAG